MTPASGWRARQSATVLADAEQMALDADLQMLACAAASPAPVSSQWEDLLAGRLAQCHLPEGTLERLISEAVADALPAMAATLERKLRFRIRREQRAQLQSCDDY